MPNLLTFHHVGVGTTDFEEAITVYESIGYSVRAKSDDAGLGVRVAFLCHDELGPPLIEILAPLGDRSPLEPLIRRNALPAPYHTCYAIDDHERAAAWLKERGFIPVQEPRPAMALDGARVAFYYHTAIGLLEVVVDPPIWSDPSQTAKGGPG